MAAAGRLSPPEWRRYADPATELEVLRVTDPAFTSGMTAPHLRQFTRRGDSLLYWSERFASDGGGAKQAFLLDWKTGASKQLTEAADLDPRTLTLSPDDRSFLFFDGRSLQEAPLSTMHPRQIHMIPEAAVRTGFTLGTTGSVFWSEREKGRSIIMSVQRQQARRVTEMEQEVEELAARPRHQQILYRTGGQFWLINSDGSGKRQLKTEPGRTVSALWTSSGRTLVYLHIPEDPRELVTLRENSPDDGTDKLIAKTSQFVSASPNTDASVFTGASRSRASAYVLILLRVTRRELTLCEHRAADPAMVQPVFSPDSQKIFFVSDRHGKPAIYQVHVGRFVEETGLEPE